MAIGKLVSVGINRISLSAKMCLSDMCAINELSNYLVRKVADGWGEMQWGAHKTTMDYTQKQHARSQ